ncbi:MAG: hypothetical protein IIW43_05660, partial [Selenomonadales bacterium]|nr:hypothetical protein [Selenomonadales bacterium]
MQIKERLTPQGVSLFCVSISFSFKYSLRMKSVKTTIRKFSFKELYSNFKISEMLFNFPMLFKKY